MEAYHALVREHTKIDAEPISDSLDQCQNFALILETPEIGAASIFSGSNTHAWCVSILQNIILDWPQKTVHKLYKSPSNYAYMRVHDTTISHVFRMPEYSPDNFFVDALLPFFFVVLIFQCYHQVHTKTCTQNAFTTLKQPKSFLFANVNCKK